MKIQLYKPIEAEAGFSGLTLLSVEEYKSLKDEIPAIYEWWWLRSPGGSQSLAAYVWNYGDVSLNGCTVNYGWGGVRPALILNPESINLKIGDKLIFNGYGWRLSQTIMRFATSLSVIWRLGKTGKRMIPTTTKPQTLKNILTIFGKNGVKKNEL